MLLKNKAVINLIWWTEMPNRYVQSKWTLGGGAAWLDNRPIYVWPMFTPTSSQSLSVFVYGRLLPHYYSRPNPRYDLSCHLGQPSVVALVDLGTTTFVRYATRR